MTDGTICLRALEPNDIDTLYVWENDTRLWSVGVTIAPLSYKQLSDYVNNYDGDIFSAKQLRLMIVEIKSGQAVGTLDFFDFDAINNHCGIGIMIAENYRRRGYGFRALRLGEEYCCSRLSLKQLYCMVGEQNLASQMLFEKAGFQKAGRLKSWLLSGGRYDDAIFYQKILSLNG